MRSHLYSVAVLTQLDTRDLCSFICTDIHQMFTYVQHITIHRHIYAFALQNITSHLHMYITTHQVTSTDTDMHVYTHYICTCIPTHPIYIHHRHKGIIADDARQQSITFNIVSIGYCTCIKVRLNRNRGFLLRPSNRDVSHRRAKPALVTLLETIMSGL